MPSVIDPALEAPWTAIPPVMAAAVFVLDTDDDDDAISGCRDDTTWREKNGSPCLHHRDDTSGVETEPALT